MTMTPERTELEWVYQPQDLFEVAYRHAGSAYDLLVENGRALATLKTPQDPVDEQLEKGIAVWLAPASRARVDHSMARIANSILCSRLSRPSAVARAAAADFRALRRYKPVSGTRWYRTVGPSPRPSKITGILPFL